MEERFNKKPLVTIIIPIYNGEKYIEDTALSVVSQTYSNWEMLLINDGSTDKTPELIKNLEATDKRIYNISLEKSSGGPSYPRNIGLKRAKGDYVAFLDADDKWDKEKLEHQINEITKNDYEIICCNGIIIDEEDNIIGTLDRFSIFKFLKRFLSLLNILLIYNPVILSSSLFRNTSEIRFREDKNLQSIEDWAFWIDQSFRGLKLKVLDEPLCYYRNHSQSISNLNNESQYLKGFVLYSSLLLEHKIGLFKYCVLTIIHGLRVLKFRFFGRY